MLKDTTSANTDNEEQIRSLMDDWVRAVRAKDADWLIAHHALDVMMFDVVNPLRTDGAEATRRRVEQWFSSFEGPIGYELRDLTIAADQTVAFCHSLNQVKGTKTDGTALEMWWRATVCFRRRDGQWVVTHAHSSVPFDTATGKASLDLEP
jgi:uncharacterized protein (TIGR02246 family)